MHLLSVNRLLHLIRHLTLTHTHTCIPHGRNRVPLIGLNMHLTLRIVSHRQDVTSTGIDLSHFKVTVILNQSIRIFVIIQKLTLNPFCEMTWAVCIKQVTVTHTNTLFVHRCNRVLCSMGGKWRMKAESCCFNRPGSHQQQEKLGPSYGNTYGYLLAMAVTTMHFKIITLWITLFSPQLKI